MDWLFGCFGGIGKKARKHGDSQKVPQLRPFQPLPVKLSPPSSIALKIREEATHHEDLPQDRQTSSGTLARKAEGILCQESSKRTAEKQKKGMPWSQLEDLEGEPEDLWNQTEEDSLDAKKIKEEVTFLKSCGTLLHTPAELRKKNRPFETQQGITPLKGWHSWLVPSSPTLKLHFAEPWKSQLAAEHLCGNIPHHVQTPIFEHKRKEGNVQAVSSSMLGQEKEKVADSHFGFQDTVAAQQDMDVHDSSTTLGDCKQEVIVLAKLNNETLMNNVSTTKEEVLLASSKLESHVLMPGNENAILTFENFPSHLKRLEIQTTTDAAKEAEETFTNVGQKERAHSLNAVQAPLRVETANFRSRTAVLNAKETPQSTKQRYHTEEIDNCASYMVPPNPSLSTGLTDDSGEILKPSPSTSSSYHDHCAAFEGMSHNKQGGCSGGGYKTGFCHDRHDGSQLDTLDSTASSSIKSEETLTDLCAENSFLHENIPKCNGEDSPAGFCVDETASVTLYSHGSTQHSVAQSGWRIMQAARHGCEYDEGKDNNLSSESISHASVECTLTSRYKQIIGDTAGFFRQEDQNFIETPIKMSQWIATPEFQRSPKVRSRPSPPVLTPVENTLQWKQLKTTKDTSRMGLSLNEQGDEYNCNAKASYKNHDFNGIKASTVRHRTGCTVARTQEESWGENEHGVDPPCKEQGEYCKLGSETKLASSNVSLSQWLTPSPEQSRGCSLASPTPLLRNYNMPHGLDAETASSLWTPMHANTFGESMSQALPIRVDMSLSNWLNAPNKQDQGKCSEVTPAGFLRHGSHSGDPNDRPILGIISGDDNSNSATARRAQWDGKGIPNTTSKYKEESRVSWHASPFEVRLERALNNQGEVLNKMCFEVASSTPVSNRLKNLQDH